MTVIAFDFDGTIEAHFGGVAENPSAHRIQTLIKTLIAEGFIVHIVTRRYGPEHSDKGLKNEHVQVFDTATKLGIDHSHVHFTNRQWKFTKLNEIGAKFHIDDDENDIRFIEMYGNGVVGFLLREEHDVDRFYNLLKK